MLLVTTAVIVGSYTVNLKVSAERANVERLRRTLVVDARSIRDLQAELRTRARPPQIQRWNDEVLMMGTPEASQYLRSPMQLASFVVPAEPALAAPAIRNAVTAPAVMPTVNPAPIVRAAYRQAPQPAGGVVAVAYRPHPAAALTIDDEPTAPGASTPVELVPEAGH
jgi:hypothetical protein